MEPYHKIWIEQCEAARNVEAEFGKQKALDYLVGEKFINFLEAAETDAEFRAEIPAFVAETATHAIDAADSGEWGKMTALRGTDIKLVDLKEAVDELKTVPKELYEEAEVFFG